MIKFITMVLLFTSSLSYGASGCKGKERVFYFNMPIAIGNKIFNDQVEICKKGDTLSGELTVPKRFTAKLENIKYVNDQLSFSITANEGRGTFQVFYSGTLKNKNKYFIGMAHLKGEKVLGPFMGISSLSKVKLEIVQ